MLPQKPFYLLRHGQSEANAAHLAAGGQHDSHLTPLGHSQAKSLAKVIHHIDPKPQVMYHSPMIRAHNTAKYVNEALGLEMHSRVDLREHDLGEWEGVKWDLIEPLLHSNMVPKGGENKTMFNNRIQKIITDILEPETRVPIIVAHGGLFFAICALYEHSERPEVGNCHLHYFEPAPNYARFPWRVWQHDIEANTLKRITATFCGSLFTSDQV